MRISGVTYVPRKVHRVRNIFVIALILILVLFLSVVLVSAYVGWDLIHPPLLDIEAVSSNIVTEYRTISFTSESKETPLQGWFFEAKGSTRTVILAHDYGSNRLQFNKQTFAMIRDFINKGYNVLTFDFRDSGRSGGKNSTLGYDEKGDLLAAIARAKALGSKQIVLMGFSMGASTSILAAAESGDVNAVIADSPFSDLRKYMSYSLFRSASYLPAIPFHSTVSLSVDMLAGIDTKEVSPVKYVKNLASRPLLLIHGSNDEIIPVEHSKAIFTAYSTVQGAKVDLWQIDGAGHLEGYVKAPEEYMERVFKFLDQVFGEVK